MWKSIQGKAGKDALMLKGVREDICPEQVLPK
jgi:hypothetical protein